MSIDISHNPSYGALSETSYEDSSGISYEESENAAYMVVIDENDIFPSEDASVIPVNDTREGNNGEYVDMANDSEEAVVCHGTHGNNTFNNDDDGHEYIDMMSNSQTEISSNEMSIQANSCYNSSADLIVEAPDTSVSGGNGNTNDTVPHNSIQPPHVQREENLFSYEDTTLAESSEYSELEPPTYEELYVHQHQAALMEVPIQVHNPGFAYQSQPYIVYHDDSPESISKQVQKSNEGLCGRCWCCYSIPFCAVYSVIILIFCFIIDGGPLTLFWSIPSTVLLIQGAKKRNKTYITIGLGIHICFGIWSFFTLGPAWNNSMIFAIDAAVEANTVKNTVRAIDVLVTIK